MAKLVLTLLADDKAKATVQALNKEVQVLSKTLSSITVNKNLTAQINALTKHYNALVNAQSKITANANKQATGIETTRKGYANLITTLKTIKSQYANGVLGKLPQDAERSFKKIEEVSAAFEKNGKLTKQQIKIYEQLSKQLKKYTADLASVKAKNDKIVAANPFTVTQAQQIPHLIKQYSQLLTTIKNTEKYYPKGTFDTFKTDLTQGQADLQALNNEFLTTGTLSQNSQVKLNNLANAYNQLNASVAQTTSTLKSSKGGLLDIVSGFAKFQLSAMLVMKPLQWVRSALSSTNETLVKTEDAVIALQRVLPSGSATDSEISSRLYKIAADYGQTFENVSEIATNFARTGMDWADTIKATEAAVLALNVAELDATEASEGLISILTQFEMTADQLTEVVDKLNKAADKNPVTTEKLLTALQRTGAAAKNANITLDETIGIITTLSKATNRSGENLGTAVNSLIQFSSKESSLDTFAKFGGDVEVAVEKFRAGAGSILEIWEELGEVIQNRQGEAESILGGGLFNNEEWAQLNDELKEALGESYADVTEIYNTASVFRRNYFVALLNDMDNVKKVTDEIADANGYSQSENKKYLNTYTAKLNSLKAQWQDLANDEQGILGFKKNLVDIGGGILTVINYTGKLNTVFLLAGAAINKLIGAKFAESLATHIMSMSKLSRTIHAQAVPAVIDYTAEIKRLKSEILTTVDSEMLLAKQTELLAMKQQRLTTIFKSLSSAVSIALVVFSAINAIQGVIDQAEEDRAEKEQEALRELHEKISASLETVEADKKLAQSTIDYATSVEELRKTLESATATESEKQAAQAQLLSIQNSLIDSNASYANSLDLVNGNLEEQLGLVEKLSEEQLRQQAKKFMDDNFGQKSDIEKLVGQGSTSIELLNGTAFDNETNKDLIRKLIEKAREQGIELGLDNYVNAPNWNPLINVEEAIRDAVNGKGFDLWKFLGLNYKKEQWTGESSTGVTLEGTLEERIETLKNFRQLIIDNYSDWGWAETDAEAYVDRLDAAFAELNSEENQNAIAWAKKEQAAEDFYNHVIDEETFVERFYGITKKTADETEEWHNNIAKVKDEYDDLIKALEKLRDAEKESLELEERKQAVLEAQKALEDARNEATARRFNEATGQWEWQTDEKAIAEAEKDLEEARQDLEEQAYDTIIDQLEQQTATNQSILDIIEAVAPLLGDDFGNAVKGAIKSGSRVDLDQPVKSYDSGGVATGLGYMPKATDRPETVNDPVLTSKILSPVSNEQFHRYVRDMGLMFETARQYAQTPVVERVGGNTDNRVDNSGQIIMNDVRIGSDRRASSLDETLAIAGIVPNE